ncbi:MAG: pyridoxamine 5'-phosphate oxidase family protein [Kiritimatiellae bacterium]|nr:pyridoxamine 5'-phosphate oxidase family protein [Kiritimatiellia bacterium]MDD4341356.1 pyridoxamine 5'-phosphate oxidase family protein [Kiritimatiellia bacterium]
MKSEVPMTRDEIIAFLNRHPVCHLATMDNGQPRVRGMFMYRADETGLMFHTGTHKAVAEQLQTGMPVEICFNNSDVQVRVAGVAEVCDDDALKQEVLSVRSFMQPWIEKHGLDLLLLVRITQCRAAVWTLADNFKRVDYQPL